MMGRPYDLLALCRLLGVPGINEQEGRTELGIVALLTKACGADRTWTYRHWKTGLTVWEADRIACGLKLHPSEIWPSWFEDGLSEPEVPTCKRGHELTPENVYLYAGIRTFRMCRECQREIKRERRSSRAKSAA